MAGFKSGWGGVANWPSGGGGDIKKTGWGQIAQWPAPTTSTPQPQPTPPPTPEPTPPPVATNTTHYMDAITAFFNSIGMTVDAELTAVLKNAIDNGLTSSDVAIIMPEIQSTQAFKTRFPGYEAYKATHNGVAINIGEYLALEKAYTDIMMNAGLPAGFYDDYSDFGTFIAKGVSPEELSTRVKLATDAAKQIDPTMKNLMAQFYGLSTGDVAAYFLDPNKALPVIEHQYKTAEVASWAAKNGYVIRSMDHYQKLLEAGVTGQQAAQGYGTVKQLDDTLGGIASIYGETYGQEDAEQDVFFNKSEKRRRITAQEQATFGGSTSGQTGSAQRQSY